MLGARIAFAGVALLVLSNAAVSQDRAATSALALCTNLPENIEDARSTLVEAGWTRSEDAAFLALYNAVAKFQFNPDDLDYTFRNAGFMAASVMGNSALGSDQISVQYGDYSLAVLGIQEKTPYCILSGPQMLLSALTVSNDFTEISREVVEKVLRITGEYKGQFAVTAGQFEPSAIETALVDADLPADQVVEIGAAIDPITLHIVLSEKEK